MTYAFTFDASACTGCKACQIACKDKNNLPVGVLWRRVYEVSGGSWGQQGAAWTNDIFAYNLSVACNHCVHPKCAGVCPTDAYVQREDGVVYIDESKCMGCGYCAWACPYSAPRYNPDLRHMTKCNLCYDNLDAGLPPACVAACPMRVLDLVKIEEQSLGYEIQSSDAARNLWMLPGSEHPFPLPVRSRTEPHLSIQPHTGMDNDLEKGITNWEEIKTGKTKSELPLIAFTLLTQMSAGMAIFSLFSGLLPLPVLIAMGGLISAGGLVAFLHLGTPLNAWRSVFHIKKSWLSREILMFGLFGFCWLLGVFFPGMGKLPLALSAVGLVFSMAQVYRLRSIQAWDTDRTLLAFIASTLLLGGFGLEVVNLVGGAASKIGYQLAGGVGGMGALLLSLSDRDPAHKMAGRLRLGLIGLALFGIVALFVIPDSVGRWTIVPIFIIALFEETIGRWLFYEHLHRRIL
jgi:anaerobic dimethyl sulfoxide reductase subunit B (iron-sulfur subunit)